MDRKEVERQAVAIRLTALDGKSTGGTLPSATNGASAAPLAAQQDASTLHDLENAGAL